MKKIRILPIITLIIGLVFGISFFAYGETYNSNDIVYDNTYTGVEATNVKTAIDDLYDLTGVTNFTNKLIAKANNGTIKTYTSGNTKEMYTFHHEATEQLEANNDYRYIGKEPNNYIEFNGETWRIIGIFPTDNGSGTIENRIKIIREESIGEMAFDTRDSYGRNDFPTSELNTYLKNTYYENSLTNEAKNQIDLAKYYLGGYYTTIDAYTGIMSSYPTIEDLYKSERGTDTCQSKGTCSGQTRSINYTSVVGLPYSSDYGYIYAYGVDTQCFNKISGSSTAATCNNSTGKANSWLYKTYYYWTISPDSKYLSTGFVMGPDAGMYVAYANSFFYVNPTIYLKSSIKYAGGDGSKENPYKINI